MFKKILSLAILPLTFGVIFSSTLFANPTTVRGIYINQSTLENPKLLNELITKSKEVGINTFVVDLLKDTKNYHKGISLIKQNGIRYVARVVLFPNGGDEKQIKSVAHWQQRYKNVEAAIGYGADAIQLDYVRYSTKRQPSPQNAKDVKEVIKWFKAQVAAHHLPLQVDIFGEVSFKESPRIGQNIKVFSDTIDVACPMVYPSHYTPFNEHFHKPYDTVYTSLTALRKQFNNAPPFKLTPYIEASNYHYSMSSGEKQRYILAQIKAVEDAKADGWYVWSPSNSYHSLFQALSNRAMASKPKLEKREYVLNP